MESTGNIQQDIERLEALKKWHENFGQGSTTDPFQQTETPKQPEQGQSAEQTTQGYVPDNGYYELKDCMVKEVGMMQKFKANTSEESVMQTIVFEYKPKKSEKMAVIVADAWNETIKYNDFGIGSYYDLSLRVSARQGKDGRWWPSVTIVFAHRLREVSR